MRKFLKLSLFLRMMKLNKHRGGKRLFKTKDSFKKFYEQEAKVYDKIRSADFEGDYIDKTDLKMVLKQADDNTRKVLECGCGTGRIIVEIAKKGYNCHGMDAAKNMLNITKAKTNNRNVNISLKQGDIENLPYKEGMFDLVYSLKVLMHLKDWKNAFNEMYRVTKDKGKIIIDFQNKHCPWRIISFHKKSQAYALKEIKKHLNKNKYVYKYFGMYSYPSFLFRVPLIKKTMPFFEKYVPFPNFLKRKLVFVVIK